jgi:hypothetical protein
MPPSLSEICVPVWLRLLGQLGHLIDKADAYAAEKKIKPGVLIAARLYPDMWSFGEQVRAVANHATRGAARLAGVEPPSFQSGDESFADLKARVAWAHDFVAAADRTAIDAGAEREVRFPSGDTTTIMSGLDYLTKFSLPNFYFHLTTAYDILRHNGVPVRKDDFVGRI